MGFKFNRGCWVESLDEFMTDEWAPHDTRGNMLPRPELKEKLPIAVKIDLATDLYFRYKDRLLQNTRIQHLLAQLDQDLELSRQTMIDLGIVSACTSCDAASPVGSCCSTGLENKFDAALLLINLLLGIQLPQKTSRPDSCHFLGPMGCLLKARDMICIDYLCPELEKSLGTLGLMRIQTVSGYEIKTIFLLYNEIKRHFMS